MFTLVSCDTPDKYNKFQDDSIKSVTHLYDYGNHVAQVKKVKFEGHTYLIFEAGQITVLHDENCVCKKKKKFEEEIEDNDE